MSKHPWNEFNEPAEPWPPRPDEPHPRAYAFGYLIGRAFTGILYALIYLVVAPMLYVRSLFGRKPPPPPRPHNPNAWLWRIVGIALVLIFWQPLALIALLVVGLLFGHSHG
jgi:hypothetical protein